MPERIQVGDTVDVLFSRSDTIFNAKVLGRPTEIWDCWTLRSEGRIYEVQQYDYMVRYKEETDGTVDGR